jgi:hypothetical protein
MSKPEGLGAIRASIVVVSHSGQSGRERGNMVLRLVSGGSVTELSVTDRYRDLSVMGASMQPFEGAPLFCFAHL